MSTTGPFRVTCDECACTLHYTDGKFGMSIDLTPAAAEHLAQQLLDRAQDCREAMEHELEQMR
jgi:hypothetical protein